MNKTLTLIVVAILFIIYVLRSPVPVQDSRPETYTTGIKLKHLRTQYKISLDDLSRFSGLSKDYLKGVEKGKYILGEVEQIKLAEILGDDFASL